MSQQDLQKSHLHHPRLRYLVWPSSLNMIVGKLLRGMLAVCACGVTWAATAAEYVMPPPGSNIIGALQVITVAHPKLTLLDIARRFGLGYHEITQANPDVSVWLPKVGTKVVLPTEFILPPEPHEGVVINIPQRRLFYFIKKTDGKPARVVTLPIGIARPGWSTPLGPTRIVGKYRDPAWFVPKSIREEQKSKGNPNFPAYFPPGPDNPMGMLAIQTGFPGIFIHGTNQPWGVGMEVSHGCLHLYPEDAAELFPLIQAGTPVRIINEPIIAGQRDGVLYLSSFEPVSDYEDGQSMENRAVRALFPFTDPQSADVAAHPLVDWDRVFPVGRARRNQPVAISDGAPGLEEILAAMTPEPYAREPYSSAANNARPPPVEEMQEMDLAND